MHVLLHGPKLLPLHVCQQLLLQQYNKRRRVFLAVDTLSHEVVSVFWRHLPC